MKRNILMTGLGILAGLLIQSSVFAQPTLVAPAGSDITWVSSASVSCGINTAVIDFPCEDITANYPYGRLAACAYDNGTGGVVVTDINSGYTVNITYPVAGSGAYITHCPDVILGNNYNSANPRQDFIMAVAYVDNSGNVTVDYFDINYPSPCASPFTVTYNSTETIPLTSGSWAALGTVHLDVIAEAGNTSLYGYPLCDQFFVTYDAYNASIPGPYNVFATYGTLNTYTALTAEPVNISTGVFPTTDGWQPDVAGVEWSSGTTATPRAIIAHVDQATQSLKYSKWEPFGTGISVASTLGGAVVATGGGSFCYYNYPRIDANDDYTTNMGMSCPFRVASEFNDPGVPSTVVKAFGIGAGPTTFNWVDLFTLPVVGTYPHPGGIKAYNHYRPAVAYSPNTPTKYIVSHCTNIATFGDFFMMSPLTQCGGVAPDPSSVQSYFEVNSTYPATSSNSANSASTPCNFVTDISLVAWTDGGNIYYKTTPYSGGGTGYAFRKSPTSVPNLSGEGIMQLFPNPASDRITLGNLRSTDVDGYSIKNMVGQVVKNGTYSPANEDNIDIHSLANGHYIMNLYYSDVSVGHIPFVKE